MGVLEPELGLVEEPEPEDEPEGVEVGLEAAPLLIVLNVVQSDEEGTGWAAGVFPFP